MLMEGIMMTKDFIMMQMGDIGMKMGCIMMPKVDTLMHKASITHLKPEM
jgi:pyruvate kinase